MPAVEYLNLYEIELRETAGDLATHRVYAPTVNCAVNDVRARHDYPVASTRVALIAENVHEAYRDLIFKAVNDSWYSAFPAPED